MQGKETRQKHEGESPAQDESTRPAPEGREQDSREEDDTSAGATAGEVGGRAGPEPTRYGDWEVNGICSDF
ncbi:DUF1674 domain-containing protein [Sandaracinobacteroides sp. A072]|uniref:DUF1674 domain-containing protein n=1 Tax=Sandaracinobacteroides sp. A072 TaxID=3461146 RepID=UPI0040436DFB